MMRKFIFCLIVISSITSSVIWANQGVLAQYISEPENIDNPLVLERSQYDNDKKITIETYRFTSQFWPKENMSKQGMLWRHTLVLYKPDVIKTNQALLFVDGGTRYVKYLRKKSLFYTVDFARIASETHSIVIDLQDIPNQYLKFDDGVSRKEDSIVAYTWNRYMDNPETGMYWPLHLPMAKAVVKAMDAVQERMSKQYDTKIDYFVVAGASKRGLTTWLAALSDKRINAIIPVVIDILNTRANLDLIYSSYDDWPMAFRDYVSEKIPDRINTKEFESLMDIEDPLTYITCDHCHFYKKRLSIPKYIISASGDDFFVPDSLNLYLNKLPGDTTVRVVPNQAHYIDMKIVEDAVLAYYQTIINSSKRPEVKWTTDKNGKLQTVTTNQQPISVKLWEAENPNSRDFRLSSHITYSAKELTGECVKKVCKYTVDIVPPKKGWKSSFVELIFQDSRKEPLVLTTSAYVVKAI